MALALQVNSSSVLPVSLLLSTIPSFTSPISGNYMIPTYLRPTNVPRCRFCISLNFELRKAQLLYRCSVGFVRLSGGFYLWGRG